MRARLAAAKTEGHGGAIRRGLGLRAEQPPAGDLVPRGERQPRGEVLRAWATGACRCRSPTPALRAVYGAMPSICVRSTPPVRWWSDGPDVEGGVGGTWLARDPWWGQRLAGGVI